MQNLKKEIQSIVSLYKSHNLSKAENLCKKLLIKNSKVVFLSRTLKIQEPFF